MRKRPRGDVNLSRPIGRCRPAHGQTGKVSRSNSKWRSGMGFGLERLLLTDHQALYKLPDGSAFRRFGNSSHFLS